VLNGSAARTCQRGDRDIIVARTTARPQDITQACPRVALFDAENRIREMMEYRVGRDGQGRVTFSIEPVE
jgi:aspartate 1-decarboxylase